MTSFDLNWNPKRRIEDVAFDVATRVIDSNENLEDLIALHYPGSIWNAANSTREQFRNEIAKCINQIEKQKRFFLQSVPEIDAQAGLAASESNELDNQRRKVSPDFFEDDDEYSNNVTLAEVEVTPDLVIAKSFYFAPGLWKHLWTECPEMMKDKNKYKKPSPYSVGSSYWECPRMMESDVIKAMVSFFGDRCDVVFHPGGKAATDIHLAQRD